MNRYFYHSYKDIKKNRIPTFEAFGKWLLISLAAGIVIGLVGTLFHYAIHYVTLIREQNNYIIWFLPLGGLAISYIYKILGLEHDKGTNMVLMAVREKGHLSLKNMVCIFIGSVITHLFGGSSGREGAALQIGGSISATLGRFINLDEFDERIIIMCGMSAGFAALFGTPVSAAFFAMEVISIGILHYSAIVPCIFSAITASAISSAFGVKAMFFDISAPDMDIMLIVKITLFAVLCTLVSNFFCMSMRAAGNVYRKLFKNPYKRIFAGGMIVALLTFLLGTNDYNGTGMNIIEMSFERPAQVYIFLFKIIFTALTLGAGFKGGEIVPVFFVGSTFGSYLSTVLGIDCSLGAALGMAAVFCAVTNCPLTSLFLSVELFGTKGFILFGIVCATAYMLSGYDGLYSAQKILYSKLKPKFINRTVGSESNDKK